VQPEFVAQGANTASQESPDEPGDGDVAEAKTKPLPKVNAVAHEVRVKVTGARPVDNAIERELFTESTNSVLVFEKGGVIRLIAAVAPGQLLFLTNEESRREVVAQVVRKRAYRPTECYVELEFTEPAPKFWGMEFSAATALLPKDAKFAEAAALIASAETSADDPDEATPPPSADEVLALKKEVEALRGQVNLPQTPSTAEETAPPAAPAVSTATPAVTTAALIEPPSPPAGSLPEAALASKSLPIEPEPRPAELTSTEQELLPKPALDFSMSLPKKRKRTFRARGNFTPGFRSGMLRLAVLSVALVITIVGAAWYKDWLPWKPGSKKISVATWAGSVEAGAGTAHPRSEGGQSPSGITATETAHTATSSRQGSATLGGATVEPTQAVEHAVEPGASTAIAGPSGGRGKPTTIEAIAKRSPVHTPAETGNPVVPAVTEAVTVPPKLIKSARAYVTLDDLRDFETGSVMIDALVDASGMVSPIRVISGPPSLREPALQALKDYRYEPAMRNGKPVPARVTVKIQFHFE
jgi:hypothetical protein